MNAVRTRLPMGTTEISKMLGMTPDEFRACKYYKELKTLFNDYNLGCLRKEKMIEKLNAIVERPDVYFKEELTHIITTIKCCY